MINCRYVNTFFIIMWYDMDVIDEDIVPTVNDCGAQPTNFPERYKIKNEAQP